MKKLLLAIFLMSTICSCNKSKEDQAQQSVREYLNENLDDPTSYEGDSFSKVDSLMGLSDKDKQEYVSAKEALHRKDEQERKREYDELIHKIETQPAGDTNTYMVKQIDITEHSPLNKAIDSLNDLYPKKFIGYSIEHKFRTKNKFGSLELKEYKFLLDTNLVVIKMKEKI